MTSFAARFNAVTPVAYVNVKLADLTPNVQYPIKDIVKVSTRFGDSLVATLFDPNLGEDIRVFLPRRYVDTLQQEETLPANLVLVKESGSTSAVYILEVCCFSRKMAYCCEKYRCFKVDPLVDQVDGMACEICKAFSICHCRCRHYKEMNQTGRRYIAWVFVPCIAVASYLIYEYYYKHLD